MDHVASITSLGYSIVKDVYEPTEIRSLLDSIRIGLESGSSENIKTSRGETYAARNLATLAPELIDAWRKPRLESLLKDVLGDNVGLVRILFFDKHPNRSWALPWHQDMTIAVKDNSLASSRFVKPTNKSGIAHVEAPAELLEQMLTLRIHLDEITEENGPLKVICGSHSSGKRPARPAPIPLASTGSDSEPMEEQQIATILSAAGDVLAMRPLISHASGVSKNGTTRHRRILHLEFAGWSDLADGFQWNDFHPI